MQCTYTEKHAKPILRIQRDKRVTMLRTPTGAFDTMDHCCVPNRVCDEVGELEALLRELDKAIVGNYEFTRKKLVRMLDYLNLTPEQINP